MNRSVRDLFRSLFGMPGAASRAGRATGKTETQQQLVRYWTAPTFIRWRSNPNWPGRRAAAARRTAGTTRRMR